MAKNKLTSCSGNSLSELSCLLGEINRLINRDYIHVKELMPAKLINQLDEFNEKVGNEIDRREDEE